MVETVDIIFNYQDANDRQLFISDQDEIADMRYTTSDFSELRLYVYQQGQLHHLDITMEDWGPSFEKAEEYEDRSIFNEKKFG